MRELTQSFYLSGETFWDVLFHFVYLCAEIASALLFLFIGLLLAYKQPIMLSGAFGSSFYFLILVYSELSDY